MGHFQLLLQKFLKMKLQVMLKEKEVNNLLYKTGTSLRRSRKSRRDMKKKKKN